MEATIVGFTELMQNSNEAYVSETGYTKRSSEMAGLTPLGVLGAFTCSLNGVEFNVSTGLSKVDRELYWKCRNDLIGSMLKFKFFELSSNGVPRFPVFLGLRSELDK
jgi:DNA ligase-1